MRIVPMASRHLEEVAQLEQMCFADPWSRDMLAEELDNACAAYLVAEESEGRVIGYAGVQVMADEGYITNIAVHPSRRHQGVASALLEVFLRFAQGNQLAFLTLEVRRSNAAAIALYRKFDFILAGCRKNYYLHPKEDALIMTREFIDGTAIIDPTAAEENL